MKLIISAIALFVSLASQAQGEANIWYFGQNAGIDFNTGSPVALTNGQLVTDEGCATISDANGGLLFYTDGSTVYNKNHQIMVNGTGLKGHPSSTQSATIVPKPGSANLYYIFTVTYESTPDGFRYSIVDMNLDNGNGTVTSEKNVLILTPVTEHLGITQHANAVDFWIVTHGWDNNYFYTYLLTADGFSAIPIVTSIGLPISGIGFQEAGCIRFSQGGTKLAITSSADFAQLYDFDTATGILSNTITLTTEPGELYGIAFSADESLLYVVNSFGKLYQFNLNASDIANSKTIIHNGNSPGQLQVGVDNKIYVAFRNSGYLGVINLPHVLGLGCNFQLDGFYLQGKESRGGLPSFNQSFFFAPSIQFENACAGESTTLEFNTNQTVLTASWSFGDGTTSTLINPSHTYTTAGTYAVSVAVTTPNGTGTNTRTITIYPKPILANNSISLKQCDDDNDGFSAFNLNEATGLLINDATGLTITFHPTLEAAKDNLDAIFNTTNYTNQSVNAQTLFARVENINSCYSTAQVNLQVSTTLIPTTFQRVFSACDDVASGSNTDGVAAFDFSSANAEIQALFPVGQLLDITYYRNLQDALSELNAITDITNYTNIGHPNTQNIYVRVDSQLNNECLGLGHHITLNVEKIPIIQPQILKECDDNQDGVFGFDTATLEGNLLNGLNNVSVTYTDENGVLLPSPLPNPFPTPSQTLNVTVKNNFGLQCEYAATITFVVDDLPEAFQIPINLTNICDNEIDPALQDGIVPFDTTGFQAAILGGQTGVEVSYFDENDVALPSPLPNPLVRGSQNIRVEVKNLVNPTCTATLIIPLLVYPNPMITLTGNELICSDNPTFTKIINAGLLDSSLQNQFTYTWFLDDVLLPDQSNYTLIVNTEGVYEVEVKNQYGCTSSRFIEVAASNSATIENIIITDFSTNNTIQIIASGLGDYVYSINDGPSQESNIFSHLESGIYNIAVKDLKGCTAVFETVYVLDVPKFFTPNGDGYNDLWNINFLNPKLNLTVQIFDRYGKLLNRFDPKDSGWDGIFKGQMQPSTDYWFLIEFKNGRNLRGHFSLKR